MKVCYYYQTFVGLHQISANPQDTDLIIVSSIHFGLDKEKQPHIYLNDNLPHDSIFDTMWTECHALENQDVQIHLMVGGAGGAYDILFKDYETYYPMLADLLRNKTFISGINIDIEEVVRLEDVYKLITDLKKDFTELEITMAPVQSSLESDDPGMGGFSYKELWTHMKDNIDMLNVQAYESFSYESFVAIVKNGYPPEKIILGMESGQFTKDTFKVALDEIKKIMITYPTFGGVYDWEYLNAPPLGTKDPSEFSRLMKSVTCE